ncbi:MAG: septum formation protein Maf, partial [Clostridia bacterium]|nr:septum formation protein Maf [Clostridia bacterium]
MERKIVLASGSPRRREYLAQLGLPYECKTAQADETVAPGTDPAEAVCIIAGRKARAVAQTEPDAIVIGADTVVVHGGEILGKPKDEADAKRMLMRLQGSRHTVYTGLSVIDTSVNRTLEKPCRTEVTFLPMTEAEIDAYIASGEPMDKAGAYGIQG